MELPYRISTYLGNTELTGLAVGRVSEAVTVDADRSGRRIAVLLWVSVELIGSAVISWGLRSRIAVFH